MGLSGPPEREEPREHAHNGHPTLSPDPATDTRESSLDRALRGAIDGPTCGRGKVGSDESTRPVAAPTPDGYYAISAPLTQQQSSTGTSVVQRRTSVSRTASKWLVARGFAMARVGSRSGARDRVIGDAFTISGARASARSGAIILASMVLVCTGCAASPGVGTQASPTPQQASNPWESSPTATPSEAPQVGATGSLSFADGAQLDPSAMVGELAHRSPGDGRRGLEVEPGRRRRFRQRRQHMYRVLFRGDHRDGGGRDRAASDEYLAATSGATTDDIATYAEDGYFALTHASTPESANGEVASRNIGWDTDEREHSGGRASVHEPRFCNLSVANAYAAPTGVRRRYQSVDAAPLARRVRTDRCRPVKSGLRWPVITWGKSGIAIIQATR